MLKWPLELRSRMDRQAWLICLLLAAVTLAAYWPVRLNDFIQYDDQDYVTANAQVQRGLSWEGLAWAFQTGHSANWHPLTWLSHMLDFQLFGLNPAGHHLTNLFFHLANTLLLFLLLQKLTGARWRSVFVAALFAVHPLHVESVAWVAERKDVLSTFFGLLSLWAYAAYAAGNPKEIRRLKSEDRSGKSEDAEGVAAEHATRFTFHVSRFYLLSLLWFAFSLLSKPMLVTFPFLLLLLDYWPLRRLSFPTLQPSTTPPLRLLLEKLPFFLLAVLSSMATLFAQQAAMSYYRQLSFPFRAANAVVSCARYLGKTFWPRDLAVFYPHPAHWPAWAVVGSVLLVAIISGLALWQTRQRPYLLVGWFWFLGLLVPALGLVQVGAQSMADRYTYLPLVGIFIILAWGGAECLGAWRLSARPGIAAAVVVLVVCVGFTRAQLRFWLNTETIFTHAIAVTQDNWVAHYNLASLALSRYQDTQRGSLEKQALKLASHTSSPAAAGPAPRDYLEEVISHCQATLNVKPGFPDPRVTLAKALTEKGRLDEARGQLEMAIRLDAKNAEARQNLGEILHRQGRIPNAITEYAAALKLRPDWPEVLNNLAWLLATHPSAGVRNGPEAVRCAERACTLTSRTNLWFEQTLAAAYAEAGSFAQAVAAAEAARQLAAASGRLELVNLAETRLELYRGHHAYREP